MEITLDPEKLKAARGTAFSEVENISTPLPPSRTVFLTSYAKCCSSRGFFSLSSFGLSSRIDLKKDQILLKNWSILEGDLDIDLS